MNSTNDNIFPYISIYLSYITQEIIEQTRKKYICLLNHLISSHLQEKDGLIFT